MTITDLNFNRLEFIAVLSDEFVIATGFGAYAYMTFTDIDQLFQQFLGLNSPVREFAKAYVRNKS